MGQLAANFIRITFAVIMILLSFVRCSFVSAPQAAQLNLSSSTSFSHQGITTGCVTCHATGQPFAAFPATGHEAIGAQDCSVCHTPSSWMSSVSPHTPGAAIPTSCISCHSSNRPTGVQGTVSLLNNLTPQGGLFDHAASGDGGTGDCVACHISVPANVGVSWAPGIYPHSPAPNQCLSCHTSAQRPTGPVGSAGYNHTNGGTGDCSICHLATPANIGVVWSGASFGHSGVTACASCHSAEMPSGTVPNTADGFTHAATFGTECATCHMTVPGNVGVTWTQGFFNHAGNSVSGLGNTCSPCHDTKNHNAGQLCTGCHTVGTYVQWPSASSTGSYGGSWGTP